MGKGGPTTRWCRATLARAGEGGPTLLVESWVEQDGMEVVAPCEEEE